MSSPSRLRPATKLTSGRKRDCSLEERQKEEGAVRCGETSTCRWVWRESGMKREEVGTASAKKGAGLMQSSLLGRCIVVGLGHWGCTNTRTYRLQSTRNECNHLDSSFLSRLVRMRRPHHAPPLLLPCCLEGTPFMSLFSRSVTQIK